MQCPNCNKPLPAGARFCGECGCRLEPVAEQAPPVVEDTTPVDVGEELVVDVAEEAEEEIQVAALDEDVQVSEKDERLARLEQKAREGAQKAGAFAKDSAQKASVLAKEGAQKASVLAKEGAQKASVFAKKTGKQMEKLAKEGSVKAEALAKEGAQMAQNLAQEGAKKTGLSPKMILLIAAAVVVVALILVGVLVIGPMFGGGGDNYALYIKDMEVFYTDFGKEPKEVTTRLLDGAYLSESDLAEGSYYISNFMVRCGDRLFYPDKLSESDDGVTIYYRDLNRKKEPEKLDSDIVSYAVAESGKEVLYLKGSDGKLYRSNLKEKEKLASDVSSFMVNEDMSKILYLSDDMTVYLLNKKGEKEKIVSDVESLHYVSDDLQTILYTKDGNLYTQAVGKDREKIASDVENVLQVWENGQFYFTTREEVDMNLWDYIEDDMAEADAMLTEPEYPEYPEYPDYPYSWDYETEEEYDAAMAAYDQACIDYDTMCQEISDNYDAAVEAYWDKEYRDSTRQDIENYEGTITSYTLHFYDGKKATEVVSGMTSSWAEDIAAEAPAAVVCALGETEEVKVKLSQVEGIWDVVNQLDEARRESVTYYVTSGGNMTSISSELDIFSIYMSHDGKQIALTADVDDDHEEGELYTAKVQTGKIITPELLDEDVYPSNLAYMPNGNLIYFKDMDRYGDSGDLCMGGKVIDTDVYAYNVQYSDKLGALVYYRDYDNDDDVGALTICKGKNPQKVADDVHDYRITEAGEVYYLYDYSDRHYTGELYLVKGSKPQKIDEDVMALMYEPMGPGQVCGNAYYMYW